MQVRFRHSAPTERIIGLVTAVSITQAMLQAFDAQMEGSWPRFWLWTVGAALLGVLSSLAETVKLLGGK